VERTELVERIQRRKPKKEGIRKIIEMPFIGLVVTVIIQSTYRNVLNQNYIGE